MNKFFYIILGTTGEYSDRDEWVAFVSDTASTAHKKARELNDLCRKERVCMENYNYVNYDLAHEAKKILLKYDSKISIQSNGVLYTTKKVKGI